ncbi:hypothetical protein ACLB2K_066702 [Fragaria x ananassa]
MTKGYRLGGISMVLVMWTLGFFYVSSVSGDGLELHFYRNSCSNAEMIVKELMKPIILTDPTTSAALLRLPFHDCQVDGCDASILLRDVEGSSRMETESDKNFGVRKLETIDMIKTRLEEHCPQTVSCADIIQLAAREAIYLTGGPYIEVLTGRRDSYSASRERADNQLPLANISIDDCIQIFRQKNISLEQGVALLGAHTLGITHCRNINERLRPASDPTLSPTYSLALQTICSNPLLSDTTFSGNDATPISFDNHYFTDIQNGRGLLKIDSEIARDPRTMPFVIHFGRDKKLFFDRFSSAFLKLSKA